MTENYGILDDSRASEGSLNERSKKFILETAKWANFLSIVGFVFLGLTFIIGLIGIMGMAAVPGSNIGLSALIFIVMIVLYFFPIFYLFKAASGLKNGIATMNDTQLTSGFENLKSHYKFLGIFTIVFLTLYLLLMIFGRSILAAVMASMMIR